MKKTAAAAKPKDLFIFDAHCDTACVLLDQPLSFARSPPITTCEK
jgi:hypothetical protein